MLPTLQPSGTQRPRPHRRALVPFHRDLRLAGLLPPVDAPHHMRAMEWRPYREGAVVSSDPDTGSLIDVGLYETVSVMLLGCEQKL